MATAHKILFGFVAWSWLPLVALAQEVPSTQSAVSALSASERKQDFSEVVVRIIGTKITAFPKLSMSGHLVPKLGMEARFGTGFCLDPACRFIATNYHVAATTRPKNIEHERIVWRYMATGPDDKEATANFVPQLGALPYAMKRDLAILELERPLRHHHGLDYSTDDLQLDQQVDIYGYPKGALNPVRKLTRASARFKGPTTSGLLAFAYDPGVPPLRGGASGGIVVDRATQMIVGIFAATNDTMAAAIPAQTLADVVAKIDPFWAQKIFPPAKDTIPAMTKDLYPKFVPPHSDAFQHRPVEPFDVSVLRQKAQDLTDSILNFIAVQSFAWGSGDNDEPYEDAAYEVRVVNGHQTFRRFPNGKTEIREVDFPRFSPGSGWVTPTDDWSQLPKLVGTEPRLKIQEAPDIVLNARHLKVFQYYASPEDRLCPLQPVDNNLFFIFHHEVVFPACYGEVWTDEDMNIVRMSERLDLSQELSSYRGWKDLAVIITYGWLNRNNEPSRRIPLTIYTEARHKKRVYWCRGHFSDYRVFTTDAKLLAQ